jgi:sporulation protein YlmC with PRC-barrel domain
MTTKHNATLYTLGDRGQTIDGLANDVRGRHVKDKNGEGIGKVADLLVDDLENKVRFLLVEHGGFTKITENDVYVDQSRERVAAAPAYTPELVDDRPYHASIYSYYGYAPWGVGDGYPY